MATKRPPPPSAISESITAKRLAPAPSPISSNPSFSEARRSRFMTPSMSLMACLTSNDFQCLQRGMEILAWHGQPKTSENLIKISERLFEGRFEDAESIVMTLPKEPDAPEVTEKVIEVPVEVKGGQKQPQKKKKINKQKNNIGPTMKTLVSSSSHSTKTDRYLAAKLRVQKALKDSSVDVSVNARVFLTMAAVENGEEEVAKEVR
ncbi:hypothetical protein TL16_g11413 [Triparma laevis f. inornata]|uniref:Uncharacterized protein n=1 Tax=Triparma laevis f. inornata TaxID=1714386 RepID=A0A9W7BMF6_9STRA|nr:hypothetical protein TL16_g11413 [Triparma laevis f. inornata]